MANLWYASDGKPYTQDEPNFFNPQEHPWAVEIEIHWAEIKSEVDAFLAKRDDSFKSNADKYKGLGAAQWSSLSFKFWGVNVSGDLDKECPKLSGYLHAIPGLVSASFSRLAPQSVIEEHRGDTNAAYRCHLGIEVPEGLPNCGFTVNGEQKGWEEGKFLFFNDAQKHSAWNKTDKRRILLILDIIRPEFLEQKRIICAKLMARHSFGQRPALDNLPKPIKGILFSLATAAIWLYMPVYNARKG
jgi:aspartyl/asparaginyl beta-hydroxylase (cupin superfamily)